MALGKLHRVFPSPVPGIYSKWRHVHACLLDGIASALTLIVVLRHVLILPRTWRTQHENLHLSFSVNYKVCFTAVVASAVSRRQMLMYVRETPIYSTGSALPFLTFRQKPLRNAHVIALWRHDPSPPHCHRLGGCGGIRNSSALRPRVLSVCS